MEEKNWLREKKSPKANLENKKFTWLLIGFVIVLSILFVAFEWSQRDLKIDMSQAIQDVVFEEEIPLTMQEEKPTPPPPQQQEPQKVEEILNIVKNDANVEESVISSSEETGEVIEIKQVAPVIEEEEIVEEEIFQVVEEMPEPPGGMAGLMQYLGRNIKYPAIAQENGIQGRVVVQFVVEKDGSIANPVVVKSVDPSLDKEAIRVISTMPKWKPGKQRGKAVRVKYTVPVTFRLQ
ncbi:MAG TPA: TonB family protein [Candidatus Avibacteroides excrementipullorum]|jgi:protein TonB|nr:TonB family protein [Candidatus Avibacteroides excrementipullorum]